MSLALCLSTRSQLEKRSPPITSTDEDFKGIELMHNDLMVIKLEIANFLVCKVLIDLGSSTGILYWSTFKQLDIQESQIESF